ncbi:LTA synthase family protein [Alkaliphilus pronyensis]|uniref:LTA synthase family protein n=1 Tax=Alkaliphilus pronyensis TaxID=1482732 RepID=A0A6I0EZG4_9FIRM|nr:LTA synthase family protein [Alkaliphilus pronyensis]KAB3534707.1 LTA synthase family protein [Alkaliphilus pronyensis]
MIQQYTKKDSISKLIFLFSGLLFLKLLVFHYFIGVKSNLIIISILNGLTVMAILFLASLIKKTDMFKIFIIINCFISIVFIFNSLYYKHFTTLLPVHIIYQINHVGGVGDSIWAILQPYHILFLVDIAPLVWYYNRIYKKSKRLMVKPMKASKVFMLVLFLAFTSGVGHFIINNADDAIRTPHNLGMINYHIYDLSRVFSDKTIPAGFASIAEEVIVEEEEEVEKNKYNGLIAGKNIIVVQAESFQNFVINKEVNGQQITPVLNQLIKNDSIYFSNYYEQVGWGNTSDAEFVSHTGFLPSTKNYSYKSYEGKTLITLPNLLKKKGYNTIVFHGNEPDFWNRKNMYPYMGFDTFISSEELEEEEIIGMGLSYKSLFKQGIPYLKSIDQPFYSLFITLTSHYPYIMEDKYKSLTLNSDYKDTILGNYFQTVNYLDSAIGQLIEDLKNEGLYYNSVIIVYGDHHGLKMQDEEATELLEVFLNAEYREDDMLRVPFLIHVPGSNINCEITTTGGMVDFFPTIANLLGISIENSYYIGKDLLNNNNGFATTFIHTAKGSFIEDDKVFLMSRDGVFENSRGWNKDTDEEIDLQEFKLGHERALAEIYLSQYILENQLLPLKEQLDILKILKEMGLCIN